MIEAFASMLWQGGGFDLALGGLGRLERLSLGGMTAAVWNALPDTLVSLRLAQIDMKIDPLFTIGKESELDIFDLRKIPVCSRQPKTSLPQAVDDAAGRKHGGVRSASPRGAPHYPVLA